MKILLHPASENRVNILKKNFPQSLLLSGQYGIGLATLANHLADKQLAAVLRPQNKKDQVDNENGVISVEVIRELYTQTRTKQSKEKVIIIEDADRMSRGAAAAFLKLLEEPSEHTHFILTSHRPQLLPLTIRSRVQEVVLQPLTYAQTDQFMDELGVSNKTKRMQLHFIASGLPAELTRLANDDEYFNRRAAIMSDSRTLLMTSTYEKLVIVQKYQSSREQALLLVDSALSIARHSISAKPQSSLIMQLSNLLAAHENLVSNFSVRLQLTQLVL